MVAPMRMAISLAPAPNRRIEQRRGGRQQDLLGAPVLLAVSSALANHSRSRAVLAVGDSEGLGEVGDRRGHGRRTWLEQGTEDGFMIAPTIRQVGGALVIPAWAGTVTGE